MTHYNLVHKFIPMPHAMKIPDAQTAVDKEWKKLEAIPTWQESPRCHIDGHLSPQKCGVITKKIQKYKGRVVLRGDIVKDDSGVYTVFTEQGASASQMTAAKIMDVIARLPLCAGQAADTVSAYT